MKTRTIITLGFAAVCTAFCVAQVASALRPLAPLSGRDREIIVDTFRQFAEQYRRAGVEYSGIPGGHTPQTDAAANSYEAAANFLESYGAAPFPPVASPVPESERSIEQYAPGVMHRAIHSR